jgi:hypothetical protein
MSRDNKTLDSIDPDYSNPSGIADTIKSTIDGEEKCNIRGKIQLERV